MPSPDADARCPCGSGEVYGACCGPLHAGEPAPTAERLMRSRYTAFAIGDAAYLLASRHASTRPARMDLDSDVRWLHLAILDREAGGPFDATGVVEFVATYRDGDGRGEQHERSRFVREGGHWFYVDGVLG